MQSKVIVARVLGEMVCWRYSHEDLIQLDGNITIDIITVHQTFWASFPDSILGKHSKGRFSIKLFFISVLGLICAWETSPKSVSHKQGHVWVCSACCFNQRPQDSNTRHIWKLWRAFCLNPSGTVNVNPWCIKVAFETLKQPATTLLISHSGSFPSSFRVLVKNIEITLKIKTALL